MKGPALAGSAGHAAFVCLSPRSFPTAPWQRRAAGHRARGRGDAGGRRCPGGQQCCRARAPLERGVSLLLAGKAAHRAIAKLPETPHSLEEKVHRWFSAVGQPQSRDVAAHCPEPTARLGRFGGRAGMGTDPSAQYLPEISPEVLRAGATSPAVGALRSPHTGAPAELLPTQFNLVQLPWPPVLSSTETAECRAPQSFYEAWASCVSRQDTSIVRARARPEPGSAESAPPPLCLQRPRAAPRHRLIAMQGNICLLSLCLSSQMFHMRLFVPSSESKVKHGPGTAAPAKVPAACPAPRGTALPAQ